MPLSSRSERSLLGRTVGTGIRAVRLLLRGSFSGGRWVTSGAARARARGAGGEAGMVRLFDLHAVSCAGDTLIAIGLAGTIFFNVPLGEARSKVALYLLVTMVPFAMLAPVVGPLLDHFRHGRRYALATTMLGRAFLAWMISDYIHGFGLYPAAFGVLALSRAYGVARSAAVPRLLPEGLGLSQVGARASVYGTVAGALVAPIGLAAFWFGPQWPLRVASVIFLVGMVVSLRLPPKADSEPPERVPRPLRALRRGTGERPLGRGRPTGRLVISNLIGAATLRAVYGFLLLFLAFTIKAGDLTTVVFGRDLGDEGALALVGGALAIGTFLATAIGTRLRIHRPAALQSSGMVIVAGVAVLTVLSFSLPMVALLCLVAAMMSGIAKLAVDASIQERIPERLRASSFAHSETALVLAFVAGGGLGLVPFDGRVGIAVAAGVGTLAAARALVMARRLRSERLRGRPLTDDERAAEERAAAERADEERVTEERSAEKRATRDRESAEAAPVSPAPVQGGSGTEEPGLAPPGFHIYRPSSAVSGSGGDDETRRSSPGSMK
ncbi:MFS transporter [Micromonospora sp. LOL_024]|uniref:MFS transporter n=1 Tax=Micromonospora sp. LOL_024 TaxID=3345412 RepID=UPI003A8C6256